MPQEYHYLTADGEKFYTENYAKMHIKSAGLSDKNIEALPIDSIEVKILPVGEIEVHDAQELSLENISPAARAMYAAMQKAFETEEGEEPAEDTTGEDSEAGSADAPEEALTTTLQGLGVLPVATDLTPAAIEPVAPAAPVVKSPAKPAATKPKTTKKTTLKNPAK